MTATEGGSQAFPTLVPPPLVFVEPAIWGAELKVALSVIDKTLYSCAKDLKALLRSLQEAMRACAVALALCAGADALLAPRSPAKVASALNAAARVPGATQRTKNTYDLSTIERTLATERDACGVGFVAESAAGPSRRVIIAATAACDANEHRGGCSSDCVSGDGAGIMTQIPWAVYEADTPALKARREQNPDENLGVATLFVPRDPEAAQRASELAYEAAKLTGFEVVAWRDIPIDPSICGEAAAAGRPDFAHVILATASDVPERDPRSLERALYLYRRTLSDLWDREEEFYVASCSSKTVVYKGMVQSSALKKFYLDLAERVAVRHLPPCVAAFAIYHRTVSSVLEVAIFVTTVTRRWRRRVDGVVTRRNRRDPHSTRHRPLLHEHDAPLVPRAALPPDRAQRRDQHHPGQRELDGFSGISGRRGHGRRRRRLLLRFSGPVLRVRGPRPARACGRRVQVRLRESRCFLRIIYARRKNCGRVVAADDAAGDSQEGREVVF